VVFKNQVKCI